MSTERTPIADDEIGPKVTQVFPNSGAQRAGLKVDDIITGVAGQVIKTRAALTRALSAFRPGDTLNLLIRRGDDEKSLRATLGDPVSSLPNRANLQNQLGGRLSRRRAGFDAALGKLVLFVGDGGGGHVHTVIAGRMDGKTAPAGADFHNSIVCCEPQLAAYSIVFCLGCFPERAGLLFEYTAGIGHGLIEEQRIKIVADVEWN